MEVHTQRMGQRLVLTAVGELDLVGKPVLVAAVVAGLTSGARVVVVDLRRVSFIDAQGLSALVVARLLSERLCRDLLLARVPQRMRRLLDITGLRPSFTLVDGWTREAGDVLST